MFRCKRNRTEKYTRLGGCEHLEIRRLLDGGGLELARFESAQEVEQYLVDDAINRYSRMFGQEAWPWHWWQEIDVFDCPNCMIPFAGGIDDLAGAPPDHSDTNTQVAGVDEADLVETDGNFLYTLTDNELIISDAWEPVELGVVSRFEVIGHPVGQFLNGDRLTVVSTESYYHYDSWLGGRFFGDFAIEPFPSGTPSPPKTRLTVLDVSDRSNPQVVQTTEVDGNYASSRAIGDHVYLISNLEFMLPAPEAICGEEGEFPCVYESQESYLNRIAGDVLKLGIPQYSIYNEFGWRVSTGPVSEPTDIFKPEVDSYSNMITISVVDITDDQPGAISSVSAPTSYSTTVYASLDSLYLTNPDWGLWWNGDDASSILKFDIIDDGARVDLVASGRVNGRLLNSFSMDEYNDPNGREYFRVATTQDWGANSVSRVYVMEQNDGELNVIGKTKPLARGEQIFSVRYYGTTGYVVTFRQTDPLFTIDLSEPTDPKVLAELKITGFSNYLQQLNSDYMMGLGRDADPQTGRARALQLNLFNVADKSNPTLADRYTFDVPNWAWSEALSDHHAIGYYPEHQILTLPVSNDGWVWFDRNGDGSNDFRHYRPRTDLYMFKMNLPDEGAAEKASIDFLGTIRHDADVRRSVRIEKFLYTISNESIAVHNIQAADTEIARIHFAQHDVGVSVFGSDVTQPRVIEAMESPETTAPQVTHVRVASSQWEHEVVTHLDLSSDDHDPLQIIPFVDVDQIKIQFSEDVLVWQHDLQIQGESSSYSVREFNYDVATNTAVWNLTEPIQIDQVTLKLRGLKDFDGNRIDGNFNGQRGGLFTSQFKILPGDVDRDGRVDRADLAGAMFRATAVPGDDNYSFVHDVDGSGRIDVADFDAIARLMGTQLPDFAPPVMGDANGDGIFNSRDLVQVFQAGLYRTGTFATYAEGDWNRDGLFDETDFVAAFQAGTYEIAAAVAAERVFRDDDFLFDKAECCILDEVARNI